MSEIERLERERDETELWAKKVEHERDWLHDVVLTDLDERLLAAEQRLSEYEQALQGLLGNLEYQYVVKPGSILPFVEESMVRARAALSGSAGSGP